MKRIRYISKGEWFDRGTEATLICMYRGDDKIEIRHWDSEGCLFSGIRHGKPDEEGCSIDEFVMFYMEDEAFEQMLKEIQQYEAKRNG